MKILLLAGQTKRTICYLNTLSMLKNFEVEVLLYGFSDNKIEIDDISGNTLAYINQYQLSFPNRKIRFYEEYAYLNNWKITKCINRDVNSDYVTKFVHSSNATIVIFSGYGGQILKHPDFFTNKFKLLHMHPGDIPSERGSTTMYYSILNRNPFTVSAFYMSEILDQGDVVLKQRYPLPEKLTEIDDWIDPILRADCLGKALVKLAESADISEAGKPIKKDNSEEYYVIHPLLKHISLLIFKN